MGRPRQLLKSALNAVLPRSLFLTQGKRLSDEMICDAVSGPTISLTFDDGPHPQHTPALLDELDAAGIRATFFVIGERAEQHQKLVQRITAAGHEIGNHTWTHSEPGRTSTLQFLNEVRRTREFLEELTGNPCRIVRPPKGRLSTGKLLGLLATRQPVVLWNCDTKDYSLSHSAEIDRWFTDYSPGHGDILLMHDVHPHAARGVACLRTQSAFSRLQYRRVSDWLPGRVASGWSDLQDDSLKGRSQSDRVRV
ncbi:MAG: polysaccharide deacetylase family protein [Planctomycetaceae bacterium]